MLLSCANSNYPAEFLYLYEGELFILELPNRKVRYIYREEASVDFEKATVGRYPRAELFKSPEHASSQPCRS